MSEVARVKVLEYVLLERERQDTSWDNNITNQVQPVYGYTQYIQLASICFALAEACKEEIVKNEEYC